MYDIYAAVRMPVACLVILVWATARFRRKIRLHTASYRVFQATTVSGIVHLCATVITEYTVNNRDKLPGWLNDLFHIVFLLSITTALALILYYSILHAERGLRAPLNGLKIALVAFYTPCALGEMFLPIEYIDTPQGSYSLGPKAYCLYAFVVFTLVIDLYLMIRYWNIFKKRRNQLLVILFGIMAVIAVIQIAFPYVLLTELGVTLIILGMMIDMEDPCLCLSPYSPLYNEIGFREMVQELQILRKPFSIGVYVFSGATDKIVEDMQECQRQLPEKATGVVCCMLTDDTLAVVPNHTFRSPYPLPDTLPDIHRADGLTNYSAQVLEIAEGTSMPDIVNGIIALRDTYTEQVLHTDELTTALTRRPFIRRVEQLIAWQQDFAFMMLDLDNFKSINDIYGHQMGDSILRQTVEALNGMLRPDDLICRMGGDEFGIVLPGMTDCRRIQSIAEKLKNRLANIPTQDGGALSVTLSIGVRISNEEFRGASFHEIYAGADDALRSAKISGKDRLLFAGPSYCYTADGTVSAPLSGGGVTHPAHWPQKKRVLRRPVPVRRRRTGDRGPAPKDTDNG